MPLLPIPNGVKPVSLRPSAKGEFEERAYTRIHPKQKQSTYKISAAILASSITGKVPAIPREELIQRSLFVGARVFHANLGPIFGVQKMDYLLKICVDKFYMEERTPGLAKGWR